jgi:hypothetical protein
MIRQAVKGVFRSLSLSLPLSSFPMVRFGKVKTEAAP